GVDDNFFDLGGHSLLMVQVQQKLRGVLERDLSITDLFRFPTVRSLTQHLCPVPAGAPREEGGELRQSVERAEARREMMLRRRQPRPSTG
ncbi:MAG: phosphopantetheine-binding protein, partial [Chloroflexota bacterium]|nr:phosphopantetheine-binding protein [Chloroflexota bacterium]